jgi:hypothetical protein
MKTQAALAQWSKLAHSTSYKGRKRVIRQMVMVKLTHIIKVLPPTPEFIKSIQKMYVNFIWNGLHWLHPHYLFGELEQGGIGVKRLST